MHHQSGNRVFARPRHLVRAGGLLALVASLWTGPGAVGGRVETWTQDGAAAFGAGRAEGVVVSDAGTVRLGRRLAPTAPLRAEQVWDLARTRDGALLAATGNQGQVYRRAGAGGWEVAADLEDSQVLSLAVLPDGRTFAGTGPGGRIVELSDPKHPETRPDPAVQYVWDLAMDADGRLHAATGPNGQLWRLEKDGRWTLLLDSKAAHLLCVAASPDGSVYAGSDGEGLVYKVARDGQVSVLHDAPQAEVRCLSVGPDGSLFAGTAAPESTTGGTTRSLTSQRGIDSGVERRTIRRVGFQVPGGTATPKAPSAGENAVYRIGADQAVREVFRVKAMIFALAWQGDRLIVGTGPEGKLYEVIEAGREATPLSRLPGGEVLSLLGGSDGSVLVGTGNPGGVMELGTRCLAEGVLTSTVLDAKLASRFGTLSWEGQAPEGTSVAVELRSGNVAEPDETWTAWAASAAVTAVQAGSVRPGRYAQYRLKLAGGAGGTTPEVRTVSLRYQTLNLAPELSKVEVPDAADGDGSANSKRMTIKWTASDPNSDDLEYRVELRKEGWPEWVRLGGDNSLTDASLDWDTTSVPSGMYRVRVSAEDRPSNRPEEALRRELVSEMFLIDHEAPRVGLEPGEPGTVKVGIEDERARIVRASYALDGGGWVPVFPDDGLFDTGRETIGLKLPELGKGAHVLRVRATDAAGNTGAGDLVVGADRP